jgi:alkanesulfonate monooxygenase SsuD/methylene tetrahydromethanopterin reductase-like flavin-dependent oxidoreductase (luciferase family)
VKLAVAFAWHVHPWEDLLALVKRAEDLGYAAAFVDGDVSMLASRSERDVLDGWTVTTSLLAHTRRIQIGSIRLVHHWNAAQLAHATATAERITPGRLRFVISIGDRPHDERFGLMKLPAGERLHWLDETLTALRGLWRGDPVTLNGRYVHLDGACIRPAPAAGAIPIAIAARGRRMLDLVAAHADIWEVNLPPVTRRVRAAAAALAKACDTRGRDPGEIGRSLWIFTRVDSSLQATTALREYRELNPWFGEIPDAEIATGLVVGSAAHCRRRIAELAVELSLDLPVIDLSGLAAEPARRVMEALAPENSGVDAGT